MISFDSCARRLTPLPLLVLVAASVAGCGGDSTGPGSDQRGEPGISIVAGADVTDTIAAPLPLALRVIVRNAEGRVIPGAVVRFSAMPITHPGAPRCPASWWAT